MNFERSLANYKTHTFEWIVQPSTPNGPEERFRVCKECGTEDSGSPTEFAWLHYEPCEERE